MTTAWPRRERTARRADGPSRRLIVAGALLLAALAGCVPTSTKSGVPGENDVALFDAETRLVFSQRMTVGSAFDVFVVARRGDDEERVLAGSFSSTDEDVLRVGAASIVEEGEGEDAYQQHQLTVDLVGPGEAYLVLAGGGEELDRILFKAAVPKRLELVDGTLLGSAVDARLPDGFALVDREETPFVVSATDRCDQGMLDVGGVLVEALDPNAPEDAPVVSPYLNAVVAEAGLWALTGQLSDEDPLAPRMVDVQLTAAGVGEPVRYEVKVVPASAVDEVDVAVAQAQPGVATLWGRAFADDEEVIGMSFEWESNARVTLSPREGPMTQAEISFPAEGEPPDDRPALVSAEVFGTEGEVDLLTLKDESALAKGRVPLLDDGAAAPTGPGCGGSEDACDPYELAALFGALLLGRRLRRREGRS